MFLEAKVQNAEGNVLDLTSAESRQKFILSSIQGLNPPPAQLNITNIYGMDGGFLNSAFLNTRNILLTMLLRGDQEASRQELYDYFNTKDSLRFFFRNTNRNVYIDAHVETVECDMFQRTEEMQVSIIAPRPYFLGTVMHQAELGAITKLFEFPFAIDQDEPVPFSTYDEELIPILHVDGDIGNGFDLKIEVKQTFTDFRIRNETTSQQFKLSGFTFLADDEIRICTISGQKDLVLIRDGVEERIFEALAPGSTFFPLAHGDNLIFYDVGGVVNSNAAEVTLSYRDAYRGV